MPRNFRIYRGKATGRLADTMAVGTVHDDGTATAIMGGHGYDVESITDAVTACNSLSTAGVELVYDDEPQVRFG